MIQSTGISIALTGFFSRIPEGEPHTIMHVELRLVRRVYRSLTTPGDSHYPQIYEMGKRAISKSFYIF